MKNVSKLTNDSQILLSIINQFQLLNDKSFKIKEDANYIFKKFFSFFKESETKLKDFLPTNYTLQEIKSQKQIPLPDDRDFYYIVKPLRDNILLKSKFCYQLKLENFFHKNISICLVFTNKNENVQFYIFLIISWLYILLKNFDIKKDCSSDEMKLFIYFLPNKKNLPENKEEIIDKIHVNTGFTYSCLPKSNIVLFRKEEWFKVFIHETFHNFGLDFSEDDITPNEILKLFNIHSKVKLYETYTDTWAIIINALFCSYYMLDENQRTLENFLVNITFYIKIEQIFIFFQIIKILYFMNLKYEDIINFRSNKSLLQYKEKTNVLAYYILKSSSLFFIDDFLSWCLKNNQSRKNFLQFVMKKQLLFVTFIKERYNQRILLNEFNIAEKIFENEIKNKKSNNNINLFINNLRKSILQLQLF